MHTGAASCTTAFDAGSVPVQVEATYSGDPNFGMSTSPSASEDVGPAGTSTSVTATPGTSVSGQAIGLSATVSVTAPGSDIPAGPSGTVDFQYSADSGTIWNDITGCTVQALVWDPTTHTGTSACTTAFAATSSGEEIQAVYSGDASFTTSTSSPVTQTVNQASTDTGVTAVVNPSVTGEIITTNAGFTISSPGSANPVAPTGTVEFEISVNGGISFSPVTGCLTSPTSWSTDVGGATCTLTTPSAVSSVQLKGIYSGDANFTTSTSPAFTLLVGQASTSTTVSGDTNPSVSGQTVNYTATVSVTPPGTDSTTPTGTVDFRSSTDQGTTWTGITGCTAEALDWNSTIHTGTAACPTAFSATSSGIEVQAEYSGDGNFYGSTSSIPVTQVVNLAQTAAAVALSSPSSVSGEVFTATATVSITTPGSDSQGAPAGTVAFRSAIDGGTMWNVVTGCATEPLVWDSTNHTGTASCTTAFDAVSSPVEIQADYSGDLNFNVATSASAAETVDQVSTTNAMTATPDVSVSGQAVDLSASVLISDPGSDVPAGASGTVGFQYSADGGTNWSYITGCTAEPLAWNSTSHTGTSSCITHFAATSSGNETRAVYAGDANFTGSTSAPATQTVTHAATATAVHTSGNPSVNGQTITVGATVTVDPPGGDITSGPTGVAVFDSSTDGGSTWAPMAGCSAESLSWNESAHNGTAQCSVTLTMTQPAVQFKADYTGDANFAGSTSAPVTQTVGKGLTSTVVRSAPNSSGPLQPVTFVATVSVMAPGIGRVSGTVTFRDGSATLCAGFPIGSSGSASCTSRIPISDTQAIVATYSGNSVLSGSSGSTVQNVRHGYWLLGADGGVFSFGDAQFYGSLPQIGYSPAGSGEPHELRAPLVGITSTVSGQGYWLVASDGGVFTFGDAPFYGSTGSIRLNKPVVAMATTPDGKGYWLVASDGGIFAYGDAQFYGSTGSIHLNKPIVGMATTPDGKGYWLVASDGGVFAFGDARYLGSPATGPTPHPVVGLAPAAGGGYWLATSAGQVYSFGDAAKVPASTPPGAPVVVINGTADGRGYWMATAAGGVYTSGDAPYDGGTSGMALQRPIVGMSGL